MLFLFDLILKIVNKIIYILKFKQYYIYIFDSQFTGNETHGKLYFI